MMGCIEDADCDTAIGDLSCVASTCVEGVCEFAPDVMACPEWDLVEPLSLNVRVFDEEQFDVFTVLDVGTMFRMRGSDYIATPGCPDDEAGCADSLVVRSLEGELLIAYLRDKRSSDDDFVLGPPPEDLALIGETPASYLAPLITHYVDPELCGEAQGECGDDHFSRRYALDIEQEGYPDARLLDRVAGTIGAGYAAHASLLRWFPNGSCVDEISNLGLFVGRRPCVTDEEEQCPAPTVADSCEPTVSSRPFVSVYTDYGPEELLFDRICVVESFLLGQIIRFEVACLTPD